MNVGKLADEQIHPRRPMVSEKREDVLVVLKNERVRRGHNGTARDVLRLDVGERTASSRALAEPIAEIPSLPRRGQSWAGREHDHLCMYWGIKPVADIAVDLGRSPRSLARRAEALGLGRGVPQGFETMAGAARRTGYDATQIRRILAWAHAAVRPGACVNRHNRIRIVEPADVDAAVARWCASETLTDAARRTGLSTTAIREAVILSAKRAEIIIDLRRARGRHWRLAPEIVDAVVAARWGSRESFRTAGLRVGIHGPTLSRWLRDAGIRPPRGERLWRLDPAVVDRVVAVKRAEGNRAFLRRTRTPKTKTGETK